MRLEKRIYTAIDILRIPFKITPYTMTLKLILNIVVAVGSTSVMALATSSFIDNTIAIFNGNASTNSVFLSLGILLLVTALLSISGSLSQLLNSKIKFTLEGELTPAILDIQASLAYKHIEDEDSWELIDRVSDEMDESFLEGIVAYDSIIRSVISILSIIGLIISQVWWSALIITIFCIPLFLISLWAGEKNYAAKIKTRKFERRYSYYSDEVLTNREAVEERTLFGYVDEINRQYYDNFKISSTLQLRVLLKTHIAMKATSISLIVITLIIAFTLIQPVITGNVSPGMFIGIITALFSMVETLGSGLQDATKKLSESKLYMGDLTTLVNLDRTEGATALPSQETFVFECLEFANVRFKYPKSDQYILNGLSFKMESGKHYSFVGENGSGKTTITKLLTGLYDNYEGEIFINDKELRSYSNSEIKSIFSIVSQDFARYQISMADNISLGDMKQKKEDNKIQAVISKVGLSDMVKQLPNGINTALGRMSKESVDLSGGEWQKIAIARSLISPAPIKILDEPTSALDPLAENQIYLRFEQLMKDKTTIFISHRLGSTKLADEILVIGDGKIVENGSHTHLMETNGLYASMYETQREWYI